MNVSYTRKQMLLDGMREDRRRGQGEREETNGGCDYLAIHRQSM